jgi:hypothetical protein
MKPHSDDDDRRSLERISMRPEIPVYIEAEIDGSDVSLLVENLSTGGATLIYPEESQSLTPGNRLRNCVIKMAGTAPITLSMTVRWRTWPKVGVEFSMTADARDQITRVLQRASS